MSLLSVLQMGSGAMLTARSGISVAANNISNADTPGYAKQRLTTSARGTLQLGGLLLGQGVKAEQVSSTFDVFAQEAVFQRNTDFGGAQQRMQAWAAVEPTFTEGPSGGLGASLSQLFEGFSSLALDAADGARRQTVISAAERVAFEIRSADVALRDQVIALDQSVAGGVEKAADLAGEIAGLNEQIAALEARGAGAHDLRARRTAAVEELSTLAPVRSSEAPDGRLAVTFGNHVLVHGGEARTLTAVDDPVTGRTRIHLSQGAGVLDITDTLGGGGLGAYIELRDTQVAGLQADLDELAFSLTAEMNTVHSGGTGLDGVSGRDLFVAQAQQTGAAAGFAVSAAVADDPDALAAATGSAALPGDNTNAHALAAVGDSLAMSGGTRTFVGFFAEMVVTVGRGSADAQAGVDRAEIRLSGALDLRDSISGVSVEEEALDLLRFQDAYQAATRVISTANDLMDDLFSIV